MRLPWRVTRRPQQAPPSDWDFVWLILAGRGWGKTRTGAETVLDFMLEHDGTRAALVAITFDDGRDTMLEGESGLVNILDARGIQHSWNRSLGQLTLPNGSRADIFSSEKARQLRGPQHHIAWGDEPAHWQDAYLGDVEGSTWSNLKLGLRLGDHPRVVLTTTPRRVRLLHGDGERRGLLADPRVQVTRGTTFENLDNLAEPFLRNVVAPYEGTRIGRQELLAEDIGDTEGALWRRALITIRQPPRHYRGGALVDAFDRIVVAVDPSATAAGDEAGVIGVGRTPCDRTCRAPDTCNGHGFALDDRSVQGSPATWARAAVAMYHDLKADRIVAEANNGGEMVALTIRMIDPDVPVSLVHASRGKRTRAEPVVALYEQGRFFHARDLGRLEDEQCTWVPGSAESPNRLDALVWGATEVLLATSVSARSSNPAASWIA
jgi:phage terminase large subunit-like protein